MLPVVVSDLLPAPVSTQKPRLPLPSLKWWAALSLVQRLVRPSLGSLIFGLGSVEGCFAFMLLCMPYPCRGLERVWDPQSQSDRWSGVTCYESLAMVLMVLGHSGHSRHSGHSGQAYPLSRLPGLPLWSQ